MLHLADERPSICAVQLEFQNDDISRESVECGFWAVSDPNAMPVQAKKFGQCIGSVGVVIDQQDGEGRHRRTPAGMARG